MVTVDGSKKEETNEELVTYVWNISEKNSIKCKKSATRDANNLLLVEMSCEWKPYLAGDNGIGVRNTSLEDIQSHVDRSNPGAQSQGQMLHWVDRHPHPL